MSTQTLPSGAIPIPTFKWRCNGGINPLIRNLGQLAQIARDEYAEACRWIRITMESVPRSDPAEDMFDAFFRTRGRVDRPDLLPGIKTAAQFLAKHGNRSCRAQCDDLYDLLQCFRLVGSYNDFNESRAVRHFAAFNRLAFFGENNPNTGTDMFRYTFGWEGSHVVYIEWANQYVNRVLTPNWTHYIPYTLDQFHGDCQSLARFTNANESDLVADDTWRLWWD